MATAKGSSKKSMRTTKAGSNEGTQGYMAPELYGDAGGTHKVDAFAFGVTIWELYAKTRPFEGVAEAAIGRKVEKGARPPLAAVGELDVRALVAACWHQTPEARPEMADVVGGIEQGGGGGGGGGGSGGGGGEKAAAAAASKTKAVYSGPTCTVDDVGVIPAGKYKGRTDLVGRLILPDTVTGIEGGEYGEGAFQGCSGLTSVTIQAGVETIGKFAFYECSGLTSVTIPAGVKTIGEGAFMDCSGLTSVTIPAGVETIGERAFAGCSGLTSVTISAGVETIGERAFSRCSGLTSVTIPAGVKTIGKDAFYGCSLLTSVTIPAGVKTIGGQAFDGCSGLTSVTIPAGVETIGEWAFHGCSGLTSATVPASASYTESAGDYPSFPAGCRVTRT
eukprot:gene25757-biopygen810